MAIDDVFALFMLIPVESGGTFATNQECAHLPSGNRLSLRVHNPRLVARHQFAGAARANIPRTIADKNVQDLCAANPIQNIDLKRLPPALEDTGWQGFTSRHAQTNGGKIKAFGHLWHGQHTGIEGRNSKENGRALLLNDTQDLLRGRSARIMDRTGPNPKGKIEAVAQTIGKEELGGRETPILFRQSRNRPGIGLGGIDHVMLQMDAAFGKTGTTRAIEPEGTIIFAGGGCHKGGRCLFAPALKIVKGTRLRGLFCCQSDHDHIYPIRHGVQHVTHTVRPASGGVR